MRFCKPTFPPLRRLLRERARAEFERRRRFRDEREEDDDDGVGPPKFPFSPELTEEDFRTVERVEGNFKGQCYVCPQVVDERGKEEQEEVEPKNAGNEDDQKEK